MAWHNATSVLQKAYVQCMKQRIGARRTFSVVSALCGRNSESMSTVNHIGKLARGAAGIFGGNVPTRANGSAIYYAVSFNLQDRRRGVAALLAPLG